MVSHSPYNILKVKVAQSRPILCNPMDYTVHGILQARTLDWVAYPFSMGSSQPRDRTQVSCIVDRFFTSWATREAQECWSGEPIPSPTDPPDPGFKLGSPALQEDSLPTELSAKPPTYNTLQGAIPEAESFQNGTHIENGTKIYSKVISVPCWNSYNPTYLVPALCTSELGKVLIT